MWENMVAGEIQKKSMVLEVENSGRITLLGMQGWNFGDRSGPELDSGAAVWGSLQTAFKDLFNSCME